MWTSRLPHREHVSRPHQSRTVVRAPRRRACSAGAKSTRCGARLAPHDEPNLGHAVSRAAHTDPALRNCIVHPNICPHRRPFCLSAPSSSSWRSPGAPPWRLDRDRRRTRRISKPILATPAERTDRRARDLPRQTTVLSTGVGSTPRILVRRSGHHESWARGALGGPNSPRITGGPTRRGPRGSRFGWSPCASGQASCLKWRTCRRIGAPPKHRSDGNGYGLQIIRPAPHRGGARR